MRRLLRLVVPLCLLATTAGAHNVMVRPWNVDDLPLVRRLQVPAALPPLVPGTRTLRFEEFFARPVGPRGLEPSAELLALDGARVRMFGYMVLRDSSPAGSFLLAPLPVTLAESADGHADDLPPAVLHVQLPPRLAQRPAPYVPGVLIVEGRLAVGPRDEPDGRRSFVRLDLEVPVDSATGPRGEQR